MLLPILEDLFLPRRGSPGTLWRLNSHLRGLGSIGRHWAGSGGVVAAPRSRGRSRCRLTTGRGWGRGGAVGGAKSPTVDRNRLPGLLRNQRSYCYLPAQ